LGLVTTIRQQEVNNQAFWNQAQQAIEQLEAQLTDIKRPLTQAPKGYLKNEGQTPNLYILTSIGLSRPVKWIKPLPDE
jgi:hypothetical protein